jgi:hypothetical protein
MRGLDILTVVNTQTVTIIIQTRTRTKQKPINVMLNSINNGQWALNQCKSIISLYLGNVLRSQI